VRGKPCFPRIAPFFFVALFRRPLRLPPGRARLRRRGVRASRLQEPADTLPSGRKAPRRGGRAVECGGLENRFGPLGPTRVQIPPPPLDTLPQFSERCPSGLRSATGNRVRAERCVAGSNPALSA